MTSRSRSTRPGRTRPAWLRRDRSSGDAPAEVTADAIVGPPGSGARRARATGALGTARKVAVAIVGTAVLVVGVALVVLPGPAFLVIPAGLAILATEFLWAGRLLRYTRSRAARFVARARARIARAS